MAFRNLQDTCAIWITIIPARCAMAAWTYGVALTNLHSQIEIVADVLAEVCLGMYKCLQGRSLRHCATARPPRASKLSVVGSGRGIARGWFLLLLAAWAPS